MTPTTPSPVPEIAPERLRWEYLVPAGTHWSGRLRRGTALRLVDVEGGANASLLFFNPENPLERYNMPDTLKAQHTAMLTRGHCLYSDMGRIFCSITADSLGWHDPLGGVSDAALCARRHGHAPYGQKRNHMIRNGRDSLLVELGKHGLGRRDLGPTVNLFSRVSADADGALHFQPGHSRPGSAVDLRFEMDTLVVLATAPHPLDPNPLYQPRPVRLLAWHAGEAPADDYCRLFRPENGRGFANTERYCAA